MKKTALFFATSLLVLSGCSLMGGDKDKPLPGKRISVLQLQKTIEPTDPALKAEGFIAPAAWKNEFWTQPGGYPNHALQHIALGTKRLQKIWSADIGSGSEDALPLTAQPVVFEDMIYTMDSKSNVSAFDSKRGTRIWSNTIRVAKEDEDIIGGGLAIGAGVLYATNGYNELVAMNPKKGGIFWRVKLSAPSRAAPTVIGDKVIVQTLDNRVAAINAFTGKVFWIHEGVSQDAGLINAASPAVDGNVVIAPLSSGELTAITLDTGADMWSDYLSPAMQSSGSAALPQISGLPVFDKGKVFAVSYGGKMVSIDAATGQRIWARDIGSAKSPWVAGNMIFLLSSTGELAALGKDTGAIAWVKSLASYDKEASSNSLLWNGPVLAGNRLLVTSNTETLYEIAAGSGELLRKTDIGARVAVPPVVAGGILYLVGENGMLTAWQ